MTPRRWSEYRLRRRVNFYETDCAGIVHFNWFFRYLEEAEHAMWRAAGLSIAPDAGGVGFPRVNASFDYHRPLRFEDEFDVRIRIADLTSRTIRYACELTQGDTSIATGTLVIACVSKRPQEPMRLIDIPHEIASRFQVAPETS